MWRRVVLLTLVGAAASACRDHGAAGEKRPETDTINIYEETDLKIETHDEVRWERGRLVDRYRSRVRRAIRLRATSKVPQTFDSEIQYFTIQICPDAWRDAIEGAQVEAMYPLERALESRDVWCMALEMGDDSVVAGRLREELSRRDPEVARELAKNELMVREE